MIYVAVIAFALGVLVAGTAYDYRNSQRATELRPAPAAVQSLVCEHLRATGRIDRKCA